MQAYISHLLLGLAATKFIKASCLPNNKHNITSRLFSKGERQRTRNVTFTFHLSLNIKLVKAASKRKRMLRIIFQITLEESCWLGVGLLIPGDGFSAEVVRGVPPGLAEFVAPLQRGGLCRLAHQPLARGVWTVYMAGYGAAARRPPDPAVHIIQLSKNSNGMGLSIVAAKVPARPTHVHVVGCRVPTYAYLNCFIDFIC